MLKFIFTLISLLSIHVLYCQVEPNSNTSTNEFEVNIDLLKASNSPAATLVGIADSEINRPTDITNFITSLRNASNNFSSLPTNFGFEFSPAWIFTSQNIDGREFLSNAIKDNLWQTFTISGAVNGNSTIDQVNKEINQTQVALGMRVSILRGKISKKSMETIKSSSLLASKFNKVLFESVESNLINSKKRTELAAQIKTLSKKTSDSDKPEIQAVNEAALIQLIKEYNALSNLEFKDSIMSKYEEKFKSLSDKIDFERLGFKLDINGAMSYNFRDNNFVLSDTLRKAALWATLSYDWQKIKLLTIIRYLNHTDPLLKVTDNTLNSTDFGAKVVLPYKNFGMTIEYLWRLADTEEDDFKRDSKWILNFEYKIGENSKLTYSFGRDFDNSFNQGGNLISALNFFKGFGSERKLDNEYETNNHAANH